MDTSNRQDGKTSRLALALSRATGLAAYVAGMRKVDWGELDHEHRMQLVNLAVAHAMEANLKYNLLFMRLDKDGELKAFCYYSYNRSLPPIWKSDRKFACLMNKSHIGGLRLVKLCEVSDKTEPGRGIALLMDDGADFYTFKYRLPTRGDSGEERLCIYKGVYQAADLDNLVRIYPEVGVCVVYGMTSLVWEDYIKKQERLEPCRCAADDLRNMCNLLSFKLERPDLQQ